MEQKLKDWFEWFNSQPYNQELYGYVEGLSYYEQLCRLTKMVVQLAEWYKTIPESQEEVNQRFQTLENTLRGEITALDDKTQTKFDNIDELLRDNTDSIGSINDSIRQIMDKNTEQDNCIASNMNNLSALTNRVTTSESDITTLKTRVEENESDIKEVAIKRNAQGNPCVINDSVNFNMLAMDIYGQSSQDGVPTPTEPKEIVNKEVSDINIHGAQLFDASKIATKSQGGATVTNNGDGSFTIDGSGNLTSNFTSGYVLNHDISTQLIKAGNLTLVGVNTEYEPYLSITILANGKNTFLKSGSVVITSEMLDANDFQLTLTMYGTSGKPIKPGTVKPMLYQDGDGTWEPFQKPQLATLSKPITLRGIPTDNGNVTIDGKQYISDVITEKDGVIGVERNVKELVLNGSENYTYSARDTHNSFGVSVPKLNKPDCKVLCNKMSFYAQDSSLSANDYGILVGNYINIFVPKTNQEVTNVDTFKQWLLKNPLTLYFEPFTPTFEPLPQADQDAIRKLKTYYPNTIITTNAFTNVKYVADTKKYVDDGTSNLKFDIVSTDKSVGITKTLQDGITIINLSTQGGGSGVTLKQPLSTINANSKPVVIGIDNTSFTSDTTNITINQNAKVIDDSGLEKSLPKNLFKLNTTNFSVVNEGGIPKISIKNIPDISNLVTNEELMQETQSIEQSIANVKKVSCNDIVNADGSLNISKQTSSDGTTYTLAVSNVFTPTNYYDKGTIDTKLAQYVTNSGLTTKLANYYTKTDANGAFEYKGTSYSKTDADKKFATQTALASEKATLLQKITSVESANTQNETEIANVSGRVETIGTKVQNLERDKADKTLLGDQVTFSYNSYTKSLDIIPK